MKQPRNQLARDFIKSFQRGPAGCFKWVPAYKLPTTTLAVLLIHFSAAAAEANAIPAEQYLDTVLQTAPSGIGIVQDRVITQVNDYIVNLTGYSRDELIHQSARIFYPSHEEFDFVGLEKYRQISETGWGTVETRWQTKQGDILYVLLSSRPLDPDNLRTGVVFTVQDITQRKHAELALKSRTQAFLSAALLFMVLLLALVGWLASSRSRLKSTSADLSHEKYRLANILEGTDAGTWEWNVSSGEVAVNQRFLTIIGYGAEELAPLSIDSWKTLAHPDDFESSTAALQKHLRGEIQSYDAEYRVRHKDGHWIWVHDRGKVISRTDDGKPLRMYGTRLDISRRKQSEIRNKLLSSILKTSKDFIGVAAADGRASYINPAGRLMVGLDSDEMLQQTSVDDYFFPEDLPFVHEVIFPTLKKEGRWNGEFRFRHFKTGLPIMVHYDLFLTEDPATGEVQNISTISQDISVRKHLEREQERILKELKAEKEAAENANRAKDEFLAVMSHEMRTPLNPILGFAGLLMDECHSEEDRHSIQCILNAGERQLRLIDDILSYSRLDRGNLRPVHTPFPLLSACESALQDCKPGCHGLELIFTNGMPGWIPFPPDLKVTTDPTMLAQLLGNLLGNACKYTRKGHVALKVGMENSTASIRRFHFCVEDTGIGISNQDASQLFTPFTQVDSSYSRSFEGAGLGLAICKKLIDLLGGTIGLNSAPGNGSSFWFTLPLETVVPLPKSDPDTKSIPASAFEGKHFRLLVVDDRPDNAQIAVAIAERLGAQCASCHDGMDAVRICSTETFDAILLDLAMPGICGFETLRLLRNAHGPNRHTPVIAVSADATERIEERCRTSGMAAYISKPIRRDKLLEVLKAIAHPAV